MTAVLNSLLSIQQRLLTQESALDSEVDDLSLAALCYGEAAFWPLVCEAQLKQPKRFCQQLVSETLKRIVAGLIAGRSTVVLYLHEHCDLFNQQQTHLLTALRQDERFNVVVILSIDPKPLNDFHVDDVWFEGPIVWLDDVARFPELEWIDVLIALDYCAAKPIRFPKRTKRINQAHGLDIKFQYSVEFYGAGLLFDYLLAPSFNEEILPKNYEHRYTGILPRCCIDHSSDELCILPFGSPKLDRFMDVASRVDQKDIVYNLSFWGLESAFVHQNLTSTLRSLLENFPGQRVVFRCFPGQRDLLRPFIAEFLEHPRFYESTADSYVDDYSTGAVLIHHRGSSAEVFSLATGSPSIRFDGHDNATPGVTTTPTGYIVRNHHDLLSTLRTIFSTPGHRRAEIFAYRQSILPHAGRSIPYFLDCVHRISRGEVLSECKRVRIFAPNDPREPQKAILMGVAKRCMDSSMSIPMLASQSADLYPDEPLLQFLAAKSIFEHIYPIKRIRDPWVIGLKYFERYLAASKSVPVTEELENMVRSWSCTVLPERFLGLAFDAARFFTPGELEDLRKIVVNLPLETLDPNGIPQKIRDWVAQQSSVPSDLTQRLVQTQSRLALEFLHQRKFSEAEAVLREAHESRRGDLGLLFLLAHALDGQRKSHEALEILRFIRSVHGEVAEIVSLIGDIERRMAGK